MTMMSTQISIKLWANLHIDVREEKDGFKKRSNGMAIANSHRNLRNATKVGQYVTVSLKTSGSEVGQQLIRQPLQSKITTSFENYYTHN
jgi:hypothetical protein